MAGVEPYSPCPCGSGQKFKWCCHKVECYTPTRAYRRLFEGGQAEAAIKTLDEGLRKEAGKSLAAHPQGGHADPPGGARAGQGHASPDPSQEPQALRRPGLAHALRARDRRAGQWRQELPAGARGDRGGSSTATGHGWPRVVALRSWPRPATSPAAIKHFRAGRPSLATPEQAAASELRSIEGNPADLPGSDRLGTGQGPAPPRRRRPPTVRRRARPGLERTLGPGRRCVRLASRGRRARRPRPTTISASAASG